MPQFQLVSGVVVKEEVCTHPNVKYGICRGQRFILSHVMYFKPNVFSQVMLKLTFMIEGRKTSGKYSAW